MKETATEFQRFEDLLATQWPAIAKARARTRQEVAELEAGLEQFTNEDSSLVVFGSLAREEFTEGSDLDWTLLIDGQTYPEYPTKAHDAKQWIDDRYKEPGREATFGGLTFSHNLVHQIGGGDDTNRNLTQRILLLLESIPIGRDDAYKRVRRALLDRYISEDYGWSNSSNPLHVPRFLQNDIARYWRTVAVDFAYKRKDRGGKGGALRTVKLRLSRKLTYAAGLIACFRCSLLSEMHPEFGRWSPDERAKVTIDEMDAFLKQTPLEIVVWGFQQFQLEARLFPLLGAYDRFLEILDSDDRKTLEDLPLEAAAENKLFQEARELGHAFQAALTALFLSDESGAPGPLYDLTRTYGVF